MGGYPYGGYRTVKTEYFSKDNGPIQNLNTRNLLLATRDNAGAQQLLARVAPLPAGHAGQLRGGRRPAGGRPVSVAATRRLAGISPLTTPAIPVLIVPMVLQGKQANNQRQAIALYNAAR